MADAQPTDPGAFDLALFERVQGSLPDDPAKDTPQLADLRRLLVFFSMMAMMASSAQAAIVQAQGLLATLKLPPPESD